MRKSFLCFSATYIVSGDHTRVVSIATPTQGGLMGFIKRTETCLGCRVPLGKSGKDTSG
jgi:DNA polymerase delta subunit 1